MTNEFCNKIEVFLVQDVQRMTDNSVILKNGKEGYFFNTDEFSLAVKPTISDAGLLYNIDETITIDKQTDDIYTIFRHPRSVILILHTHENNIILGTLPYPAKVILNNHLNKSQLQIRCSCIVNPF